MKFARMLAWSALLGACALLDPVRAVTPREVLTLAVPGGPSLAVDATGATAQLASHAVRLEVRRIGRAGADATLRADRPTRDAGGTVTTARTSGVTEWWRRHDGGLEHGFTVASRPAGTGPLRFTVDVGGSLRPRPLGSDVALVDPRGARVGRYAGLTAIDARGVALPAHVEVAGRAVTLVVDDQAARYPLVVDPMLFGEEALLLAPDRDTLDWFGVSVALSGDGSRLIVGADSDDDATGTETISNGAAYVFVRTGASWTFEQKLLAPDKETYDYFGTAVGIDARGDRVVVGAHFADGPAGAPINDCGGAYVFVRTGTTWTLEQTLLASDAAPFDHFGGAVSMSADGGRVVVGARDEDDASGTATTGNGAAYVFVRSGAAWTQESKLLAWDKASASYFATSVGLSADGDRVVAGAPYRSPFQGGTVTNAGAVYVYTRGTSGWAFEAQLLASDRQPSDFLGDSVAISGDGTRIVATAPRDDEATADPTTNNGAAYVFTRAGTSWAQEVKLFAAPRVSEDALGAAVSMDALGERIVVTSTNRDEGGASPRTNVGAAFVFTRSGTTWSLLQERLATDREPSDFLGESVDVDDTGTLFAAGTIFRNDPGLGIGSAGAAYVFSLGAPGAPCGAGADCASGACTDGVCCAATCGAALDDCTACARALTGQPDGECAPLAVGVAETITCRASGGGCDPEERCVGLVGSCPADVVRPASAVCRPAAGICDLEETCDGVAAACPPDGFAPSGAICRDAADVCDVAESCDGSTAPCPTDLLAATGTVCRASSGPCDRAEVCSGASDVCPGDAVQQAGTPCRLAVAGGCDLEEVCDGVVAVCPPDAVRAAGTLCRAVSRACDVAEACDGLLATCPADGAAPDGTPCDDGLVCSVSSACATGQCAAAVTLDCSDGDPCTTDGCSEPSGCVFTTVAACVADAGLDAALDAAGSDAATEPTAGPAGGCSCRVAAGPDAPVGGGGLALVVALAIARSARRRPTRRTT